MVYVDCHYDGYLKKILDGYKNAVLTKNTSMVVVIDGRSGMGKTTLANQIGNYLDPNYNLEKVFYEPDNFLQGLANAKKGDFLLFDEAMLISSRSALSEINRMIIQAMSMIRSKQLFICFCVNSIFDLDRNLALSRADLLLHVYGDNLIDRGKFTAFYKSKDGMDRLKTLYLLGKKMYSYSKPKANFYGRFYSKFILDEQEYERRKQEGVNNFLRGHTKLKKRKRDEWLKDLIVYVKKEFKLTNEEISEVLDCSVKTISNIINQP